MSSWYREMFWWQADVRRLVLYSSQMDRHVSMINNTPLLSNWKGVACRGPRCFGLDFASRVGTRCSRRQLYCKCCGMFVYYLKWNGNTECLQIIAGISLSYHTAFDLRTWRKISHTSKTLDFVRVAVEIWHKWYLRASEMNARLINKCYRNIIYNIIYISFIEIAI